MGVVAIVAGVIKSGYHPLVSLSGTVVTPGRGLGLIFASLAVYMLPLIAVASIALLLSTVTHNSAAAVVGALMISLLLQLVTIVPGLGFLQPYLLPTQFNAWQGFLRTPADWAPIVRAVWVCALYAVPCLALAFTYFARRDVSGG
jgi:ABC-2 type transport system permease protein